MSIPGPRINPKLVASFDKLEKDENNIIYTESKIS
jgi:hypothetical protein